MKKKVVIENLSVNIGKKSIIRKFNLDIYEHEILSIIGPANSGKSTFLRALNRLLDINPSFSVKGKIFIDGENIYRKEIQKNELRKRIGMIFALPTTLPMSVYDNLAYGPRLHGETARSKLLAKARECLILSSLWDEVKDRLDIPAVRLSGGQQQRLCLARALMVSPEIILFDEPCSGLDPVSTAKVEASMIKLKKKYTIVLVTNNTKQAARVGDRVAFFLSGDLVEVGKTEKIFTAPKDERTNGYITGRFG